jgi:hypothetical protein
MKRARKNRSRSTLKIHLAYNKRTYIVIQKLTISMHFIEYQHDKELICRLIVNCKYYAEEDGI